MNKDNLSQINKRYFRYFYVAIFIGICWITTITILRCERLENQQVNCLATTRFVGIPVHRMEFASVMDAGTGYEGSDASGYIYIVLRSTYGTQPITLPFFESFNWHGSDLRQVETIRAFLRDETMPTFTLYHHTFQILWTSLLIGVGGMLYELAKASEKTDQQSKEPEYTSMDILRTGGEVGHYFVNELHEDYSMSNDPEKIRHWGTKVYLCPQCSKLNHINDGSQCMACKSRLSEANVIDNPFL